MAATAPKIRAIGLEPTAEAAPVCWGTPPVVAADPVGCAVELPRVADEMVLLPLAVVETVTEALEVTEAVEAAEDEAAADELAAEEAALEVGATPPVRGNKTQ